MSSIQELDLCFSQVFPKNASAPAGMKNGVAPGSPGVKQLTRRNCSLLNCEGIEADGRRPRGSRAPQRSETKISSTRLSSMTRNGLIATCFVCLLIAGTGRAHGLDSSKRLTQYHHNVWRVQDGFFPGAQLESGVSEVCQSANPFRRVQDGISGVRYQESRRPPTATFAWEPHPDSLGLTV
jgi:hypothetical protein